MQHHGWSLPSKLMLRQLHARGTRLAAQDVQAVTHHALVGSCSGSKWHSQPLARRVKLSIYGAAALALHIHLNVLPFPRGEKGA